MLAVNRTSMTSPSGIEFDSIREGTRGPALPAAERATADSLRQQLHTYRHELARVRAENQALREQLARRLGADRATAVTSRP
jgi:hypothetical protein